MFSERKRIWLFFFLKEKKGNLFLRFWLILFSERKKKFYFLKGKKKDLFCFKNFVVSVLEKKRKKSLQNQTNKLFVGLRKRKS